MGAKSIIARYVERNRPTLPSNQEELRQHLAAVASGANLNLTEKELDELVQKTETGDGSSTSSETVKPDKVRKPKSAEIKAEAEKSGNATSAEI